MHNQTPWTDKPVTNYALTIIFGGGYIRSIAMTLSFILCTTKSIGMVSVVGLCCIKTPFVSFLCLSVFMARAKVVDIYDTRGTAITNDATMTSSADVFCSVLQVIDFVGSICIFWLKMMYH